ncbi:cytochrome P450 [Xylaria sp. FL0043]|nr:cytochrome P450 [Xylaria sp. FL0043]
MIVASALAVLLAFAIIYRRFLHRRTSDELLEPPVIRTTIPLLGHIIGMARHGKNYYQHIRGQCRLPIVTLPLVGSRVYVVFSVPMIQSIQKQSKSFSFEPIQAKFSTGLCGASKDAYDILQRDLHREGGVYGAIHNAIHHALSPGKFLNEMNMVSAGSVLHSINDIRPGIDIKLDEWLRHQVTLATTDAVYGPYNPFRVKEVEAAFWAFEQETTSLFLLPQCFSPKAVRNRKVVSDAFQNYYQHGYHEHASALIKNFYAAECSHGYALPDRARFEVGNALGMLENIYPAVFWLIFYVFSNPRALRRIRKEVSNITATSIRKAGGKQIHQHVLDLNKVNSHCPFLVSTFKETMRIHSAGVSIRQVCQDTILHNTYRLKKDATILMPTISIHTDPSIWGADALSFNYERFLSDKTATPHKERASPAAFRTFGGGTTLCPGRHFATTQIMVWISMLAMRFDVEPALGRWDKPGDGRSNLANVIVKPERDVEVRFIPREYYNNGMWDVRLVNPEVNPSLTVNDLVDDTKLQGE